MAELSPAERRGLEWLAKALIAARRQSGDSQSAIAARGGPSTTWHTTLERLEGPVPSAATFRKIDKGYEWQEGTAKRVFNEGIEPPARSFDRSRDLLNPSIAQAVGTILPLPIGGPLRRLMRIQQDLDDVIRELRGDQ